jgi:hypothetical protein
MTTQKSLKHEILFHNYGSILVLVLIAVVVSVLFWKLTLPRMDFYNELWGPTYLLVHRQSPYNTTSLDPVLPPVWLPMSIGFFFPLGWLPEELALKIWYIFNILEIGLIIYFVQGQKRNVPDTVASALMCFFFPLMLNHINLGQFSITVALCWVMATIFLEKDWRWLSPFCIALALTKPHLGFLAMLGLSYRDYQRGKFHSMLWFWARILVICLALCIPLFIAYPNWIPDAITSMGKNPAWSYPSLYILFERYLGLTGHVIWGITSLSLIGLNFWLWKKLPLRSAIFWSLSLALLVTPYVGSWDFVVLFPMLILTYITVDWKRKIFVWVVYCVAWYGMALIQILAVSHNHYFWWVPLCFVGAAGLITDWETKTEAAP